MDEFLEQLRARIGAAVEGLRRHAGGAPFIPRLPASADPRTAAFVASPMFQDTIAPMTGLREQDIRLTSTLDSLLSASNLASPRPDNPSFVPRGKQQIVFNPEDATRPDTPFHEALHVLQNRMSDSPEMQALLETLEAKRQQMVADGRTDYATTNVNEMLAEAGALGALPALRRSDPELRERVGRVMENGQPGAIDMTRFLSQLPPFNRPQPQTRQGEFPVNLPEFARMVDTSNAAIRRFQADRDGR